MAAIALTTTFRQARVAGGERQAKVVPEALKAARAGALVNQARPVVAGLAVTGAKTAAVAVVAGCSVAGAAARPTATKTVEAAAEVVPVWPAPAARRRRAAAMPATEASR
jgi:hypothetical protein